MRPLTLLSPAGDETRRFMARRLREYLVVMGKTKSRNKAFATGDRMKRQVSLFCAAVALTAVMAVASGYAQSRLKLQADIPFEFVASNVTFPAGHYTFRAMQPGRVLIQSADYRNAGVVMTISEATGRTSEETKLIFNRYGNK